MAGTIFAPPKAGKTISEIYGVPAGAPVQIAGQGKVSSAPSPDGWTTKTVTDPATGITTEVSTRELQSGPTSPQPAPKSEMVFTSGPRRGTVGDGGEMASQPTPQPQAPTVPQGRLISLDQLKRESGESQDFGNVRVPYYQYQESGWELRGVTVSPTRIAVTAGIVGAGSLLLSPAIIGPVLGGGTTAAIVTEGILPGIGFASLAGTGVAAIGNPSTETFETAFGVAGGLGIASAFQPSIKMVKVEQPTFERTFVEDVRISGSGKGIARVTTAVGTSEAELGAFQLSRETGVKSLYSAGPERISSIKYPYEVTTGGQMTGTQFYARKGLESQLNIKLSAPGEVSTIKVFYPSGKGVVSRGQAEIVGAKGETQGIVFSTERIPSGTMRERGGFAFQKEITNLGKTRVLEVSETYESARILTVTPETTTQFKGITRNAPGKTISFSGITEAGPSETFKFDFMTGKREPIFKNTPWPKTTGTELVALPESPVASYSGGTAQTQTSGQFRQMVTPTLAAAGQRGGMETITRMVAVPQPSRGFASFVMPKFGMGQEAIGKTQQPQAIFSPSPQKEKVEVSSFLVQPTETKLEIRTEEVTKQSQIFSPSQIQSQSLTQITKETTPVAPPMFVSSSLSLPPIVPSVPALGNFRMEIPAGIRLPGQPSKPVKTKYVPTLVGIFTGAKAGPKGGSFFGVEVRGLFKRKKVKI